MTEFIGSIVVCLARKQLGWGWWVWIVYAFFCFVSDGPCADMEKRMKEIESAIERLGARR